MSRNRKSGTEKRHTRYKVNIRAEGKKQYPGTFTILEETVTPRKEAEE